MTNSSSLGIRFFRNTLILATAIAMLGVMTLPRLASATTPPQTAVTSITVGANPTDVAVSPDGSSVWVANYSVSFGICSGNCTVSRINTSTNAVSATITVGTGPRGIAVSPDGSSVWVANQFDNTVSQINTTTNAVTDTITVGTGPWGVAVSPDGSSVWVTNFLNGTVSRIDPSNNAVSSITVGNYPIGLAVSPDGSSVWVANNGAGGGGGNTVSRISTVAPYPVTNTITVGTGPSGVAVSPDGSSVWVTNNEDTTVSRINTSTNAVTTTITFGVGLRGVAVSPDGSSVWVTNFDDGTASRINTTTNAVTDTITVGTRPWGVAVSPDGSSVWVTNGGGDAVSRIIFPPRPPVNLTATPGNTHATISWTAPTNTGGSPITSYTATASPGDKSCMTTTATSCTISGLTNGTTYSVSVTASNAVGTSDPSVVAVTLAVPLVTAAIAELAATGSDLFSPSWLGVALFGFGGGALFLSRRRKTQTQS